MENDEIHIWLKYPAVKRNYSNLVVANNIMKPEQNLGDPLP